MRTHGNILEKKSGNTFLHKSKTMENYYMHNTGMHLLSLSLWGTAVFILIPCGIKTRKEKHFSVN